MMRNVRMDSMERMDYFFSLFVTTFFNGMFLFVCITTAVTSETDDLEFFAVVIKKKG